jgi:RNA polymerase sigma-70 factor, ECF subfamily
MPRSTQEKNTFSGQVVPLHKLNVDDSALVEALKKRHPGARELLYDRYATHVQRVLVRVLGIDTVLPELLHDVFIEAFTHVDSIKDGKKLKGWLSSIAVFTARGYIRKRKRSLSFWFGDVGAISEIAAVGVDHDVREALACTYRILDRLPADERIAFALRFIEGMELTEVAEASRVSLATIKRRLARAKRRFSIKACEHPVLAEWTNRGSRWGEP